MDRRTPEEKQATMEEERRIRQNNATALVRDLHDAGESALWIESTQISGDGHFFQRVVIDSEDIDHVRFEIIRQVAEVHDAKISLHSFTMNQQHFSRVTLWPSNEED
jgi:acid stress-induced BolA-like protein IbaG/YrbA